ncbi:MAG: hypothetical protein AB1792_03630 [Candidatus Zixiibacteriota bacterium]
MASAQGPAPPRWLICPSGAVAIPTGRFAETIKGENPKDGHKTGFTGALELGRFLSQRLAVGIAAGYTRFPLDFSIPLEQEGSTKVLMGQLWGRYFLAGGYAHWQPYLSAGIGIGRPKVSIDFPIPVRMEDTLLVDRLESTVDLSLSLTGGVGVRVPIGDRLAFLFEPRYVSISTKGTNRTDKLRTTDGRMREDRYAEDGSRLKDKSRTNWWDIRVGVMLSLF